MATAPHSAAIDHLWAELHKMEPTTQKGGDYADKPGYHNTRAGNDPHNYSVVDAVDKQGPDNLAAAFDWTFPEAQSGHYDLIAKYSARLLASGKDANDDRLDWMREFYGQADKDTHVEGWDFRYAQPASSDPSHLWHIHFSFSRNALTVANMDKLLEVLRGDDEMPTADEIADAVWNRDVIPAPQPPNADPDVATNPTWRGKNSLARVVEQATEAARLGHENAAKLDQILAALAGGTPLPPAGTTVSVTGTLELTPTD